jgi:YD repeat-containing protein
MAMTSSVFRKCLRLALICLFGAFCGAALADMSFCSSGPYQCSGVSLGRYSYDGGSTSACGGNAPIVPRDPIGTWGSLTGAGGPGFQSEADAADFVNGSIKCAHAPPHNSIDGHLICSDAGVRVVVPTQITGHWTLGGLPAQTTTVYEADWNVQDDSVPNPSCAATVIWGEQFSISGGNSIACSPTMGHSTYDVNNVFCFSPRYCPHCEGVGNPIALGTNEKRQVERDFEGAGAFPLKITRYYASESLDPSLGDMSMTTPPMGPGWRTEYHREVSVLTSSTVTIVTLRREDGESRAFVLNTDNSLTGLPDEKGRLERLTDGSGNLTGWAYHTADESVESYGANGKLQSLTNPAGFVQTLAYDASSRLDTVTDPFGRVLQFHYNSDNRVDTITAPGSLVFAYTYTSYGAPETVTYPDSSVRRYHYETDGLPWGLTGITDENGVRTATYTGLPPVFRTLPIGANMAQEVVYGEASFHARIQT